jgi:hypothetical protein
MRWVAEAAEAAAGRLIASATRTRLTRSRYISTQLVHSRLHRPDAAETKNAGGCTNVSGARGLVARPVNPRAESAVCDCGAECITR